MLVSGKEKAKLSAPCYLVRIDMVGNRIVLRTPQREFVIELNDSATAEAVYQALPLEEYVNVWGEEIYFAIPVQMKLENGKKVMEVGEVAYWPQGDAFCVFFGPTPVSKGPKPEAYSMVSPIGMVTADVEALKEIGDRTLIRLERA
jgi:uncharacterized protein